MVAPQICAFIPNELTERFYRKEGRYWLAQEETIKQINRSNKHCDSYSYPFWGQGSSEGTKRGRAGMSFTLSRSSLPHHAHQLWFYPRRHIMIISIFVLQWLRYNNTISTAGPKAHNDHVIMIIMIIWAYLLNDRHTTNTIQRDTL